MTWKPTATAFPELAPDQIFCCMRAIQAAVGHRGLISAGTGLGEALLVWDGKTQAACADARLKAATSTSPRATTVRSLLNCGMLQQNAERPRQL